MKVAFKCGGASAHMNQQRLQSYVDLIQQLLACPTGEEWILLRQNEALVTPEFVQVIEQVATQLVHQGNLKEGKFLHNLAGQIHHMFVAQATQPAGEDDHSQHYLELIKALLDCPQGNEGEILEANQALIGPGLVQMMRQVAAQLADNGQLDTANYLQRWAVEISRLWLQKHDFKPAEKQEPAPKHLDPSPVSSSLEESSVKMPQPIISSRPSPTVEEDVWADPPQDLSPVESDSPSPLKPLSVAPTDSDWVRPTPGMALSGQISDYLETIAQALVTLSETLTRSDHAPSNPLWYMDVLERAQTENWVLTSTEIYQLMGVHPTCSKNSDSFQRGCWVFVKTGKVGAQTGWRVKKELETTV